jgi:hypothetical protein
MLCAIIVSTTSYFCENPAGSPKIAADSYHCSKIFGGPGGHGGLELCLAATVIVRVSEAIRLFVHHVHPVHHVHHLHQNKKAKAGYAFAFVFKLNRPGGQPP